MMVLSHESLEDHFNINYAMIKHHKFSLAEINEMMPWERDVYLALIRKSIKDESNN